MPNSCVALLDCNNFFASCERIFRPDLRHKPIVVLSNNDGCVVARSQEAKALGIKMGIPFFKVKPFLKQHDVQVFSSNYALYGDISKRVMDITANLVPKLEVYSIDEAFLDLSGMTQETRLRLVQQIQKDILQAVGIQVGIGYSRTKTLAKLANYGAKKYPATGGIVDLTDPARQRRLMAITPVAEVWGVGRRLTRRLEGMGIQKALDLADYEVSFIRQNFSVTLERTVKELNGVACQQLEHELEERQQIIYSRGFSQKVRQKEVLKEAVASYTEKVVEKLRQKKLLTQHLTLLIMTSRFKDRHYFHHQPMSLPYATNDSRVLVRVALNAMECIWQKEAAYNKVGIVLNDLIDVKNIQPDLFSQAQHSKSFKLMETIDAINLKHNHTLSLASQGFKTQQAWQMKRRFLSPSYTTKWSDIPLVEIA